MRPNCLICVCWCWGRFTKSACGPPSLQTLISKMNNYGIRRKSTAIPEAAASRMDDRAESAPITRLTRRALWLLREEEREQRRQCGEKVPIDECSTDPGSSVNRGEREASEVRISNDLRRDLSRVPLPRGGGFWQNESVEERKRFVLQEQLLDDGTDSRLEKQTRNTPAPANGAHRPRAWSTSNRGAASRSQSSPKAGNPSESDWNRSVEFKLLRDEALEATRHRPETRSLYHSLDMNAFAGEPSSTFDLDDDEAGEQPVPTAVPPNLPPHRAVNGAVELAGYLASSDYIISLGGPPLPDLRYGVIIVPIGEESLLFSGYGDHAALSVELEEQIRTKKRAGAQGEAPELSQKPLDGWANDARSDASGLDSEEKEFYRRKWLARKAREAAIHPVQVRGGQDAADSRSSDRNADESAAPLY
ncbi:hypothetical protein VTK26DRAFT_2106 [Humicola hyalothermophila]